MMIINSTKYRWSVVSLLCIAGFFLGQSATYADALPHATVTIVEQDPEEDSSSPGRHAYTRTGAEFEVIEAIPEIAAITDADSAAAVTVDINSASIGELAAALPGIGPGKAQRIVEWREINGPFQSVDQLLDVSGIGPVTLENIRPLVRIGDLVSMHGNPSGQSAQEQAVILALASVIRRVVDDRDAVMQTDESSREAVRE